MLKLKFSKLFLLSQSERRGLRIEFGDKPTVIKGDNQMGKSAIIKSLYDAFGAEPHQIDRSWKGARVAVAVQFSAGGIEHTILKLGSSYAVFDLNDNLLMRTSTVVAELGPFLANMFNFQLVMMDRDERVVIPPPSYIFSPYYVDQDKGWTSTWSSFDKMYLPNSRRILSEYHSGVKPNEYYVALAERNQLRAIYNEKKSGEDNSGSNFPQSSQNSYRSDA